MDELIDFESPSPNWNERKLPVSMVVLHYTGMQSADEALERLCDAMAGVSAHYLIEEDGKVHRLVREDRRAWHAGKSFWRGITDINSASIGIELVNPGHEWGYRPFPEAQMEALIPLLDDVVQLVGGLRAGMGYCGTRTIEELRTITRFIQVSPASVQESHPHDITIVEESPNYSGEHAHMEPI